jgi:hypothetical protein
VSSKCSICGLDPYDYVDIGIGFQAVAVTCCEYGDMLYAQGLPYEHVKEIFIKQEGYEPPYKENENE